MYITLRLICENFGRVAVKISFLWGPKYGVYAAPSVLTSVTSQNFTFAILYMKFVFIAQRLFCGKSEISYFLMHLHAIRNFGNHKAFASKHMSTLFTVKI